MTLSTLEVYCPKVVQKDFLVTQIKGTSHVILSMNSHCCFIITEANFTINTSFQKYVLLPDLLLGGPAGW